MSIFGNLPSSPQKIAGLFDEAPSGQLPASRSSLPTSLPLRPFFLHLDSQDNPLHLARGHMAVYSFAHKSHRGQGTASHTGHPLNTEFSVRGGFPFSDAEFSLKIFKNDITCFDMAGSSEAHFDRISPRGNESELIVKCRHTINFPCRNFQMFCHHFYGFSKRENGGWQSCSRPCAAWRTNIVFLV